MQDTLVIVGDMIEKGPESLKTVRYIMKLRAENPKVYAGREMDFDTNKMQPKCVILLLE